jgi:glycosyltransferase involved in cell wall biosynthesis
VRIALISDWYLPRIGGLELHLRDLGRNLVRHGHQVDLLCVTPDPSSPWRPGEPWVESEDHGVRIHRLDVPRLPRWHSMFTPDVVGKLTARIERIRPDVLHTHNAFSPLAHVGAFVGCRLGLPSLFTECSVLRGNVARGLYLFGRVVPWGRWPTLLSGVSRYVAEDVRRATGRDESFVLHNGIDLTGWACERRESARPRVTTVMRFTLRKRPTDVIRIIPRVHAALPKELRPIFTLVGDGTQMGEVQELARRLGVAEHVELPGFQPRERVRDILASSWVFCLPTRKEAMSIATLEALASGCPAVAMNLGGVSDVVEHGREGFLANDLDEFAGYIVELVRNHDLRARIAGATRTRVGRFAWDTVIARHENLFQLARQRTMGASGGASALRLDELGFESGRTSAPAAAAQ